MSIGPNFSQNPSNMAQLFDLARRLFLQGLSGSGAKGPQGKIKICVGKQCVTLDENLKKDPTALFRVLGQLAPGIISRMFQGGFGGGIFGPRRPPTAPSPRTQPPTPSRPRGTGRAAPRPTAAPPALQDYASIARAGANATGREAQLSGLRVTSVATDRVVLEGPQKEMIVLRIPADKRHLLPSLRTAPGKVNLRFRILNPPVGKILHGELIEVKGS
jgi:hypothetical protein